MGRAETVLERAQDKSQTVVEPLADDDGIDFLRSIEKGDGAVVFGVGRVSFFVDADDSGVSGLRGERAFSPPGLKCREKV